MRNGKFWFNNEKKVMRALGFEPTKGSGSGWIDKEDGESEFAIAQLKSTDSDSYRINYLDLQKLEYHASVSHKLPVFIVEFLNRGTYILVNVSDFENLKDICLGDASRQECIPPHTYDVICSGESDVIALPKHIKSSKNGRDKFHKEREERWKK